MVRGEETLRVLAFISVVGIVYAATAIVLVRRWLQRPRPALRWPSKTVLVLAAFGVLCMLYGRFVEPRWIEVTETRVETARLPAGHRGFRIVHLSDVHSDPAPLVEERLSAIVAALRPDAIVFTGDAANSPEGVPVFKKLLTELAAVAPTFAVKGNWDCWFFPRIARFADTGATELDGTSAEVAVDGAKLRIVGIGFESSLTGIGPALARLPADGPAIVLFHPPYPEVVPREFAARIDLICAGHVHGGQVALPWYGALLTLSKHGKKYERGLYRTGEVPGEGPWMYVSRGIGMEGGAAPRVRFCSRPEVALIEIVPAPR